VLSVSQEMSRLMPSSISSPIPGSPDCFRIRIAHYPCPLDVTRQVYLTPQIIEEKVVPVRTVFSRFLIDSTGYDFPFHRFRRTGEVFHLHDPLAIGVVIAPDLVKKAKLSLRVETEAGTATARHLRCPGRPRRYDAERNH